MRVCEREREGEEGEIYEKRSVVVIKCEKLFCVHTSIIYIFLFSSN